MPRFRVQYRNGTYHIFDTVYYGVASTRDLAVHAEQEAARLNARQPKEPRRVPRR